ncbi:MAG: hemerythrin family protein [Candidatus Moranbacteria bacterium]|nr:hemerythrin family protein [Candidatus Moranbacteria bacterium]
MADHHVMLEWEERYSVGVALIDQQHQQMFRMINDLADIIHGVPDAKRVTELLAAIVLYKRAHFATEEEYFKQFNYEGAAEHITEHRKFDEALTGLTEKHAGDTFGLAFELIDFLEDWLIQHLLNTDQKYKECFLAHGLK